MDRGVDRSMDRGIDRGMEPGPFSSDQFRREMGSSERRPPLIGSEVRPLMSSEPNDVMRKPPQPGSTRTAPKCELIVQDVNGRQCMYAENVKSRLSSAGLATEMVRLSSDNVSAVSEAVQESVRRRVLFACIINAQNEMHRSMTVNILYGQLQEHRNMPLERAISLILQSFEEWSQSSEMSSEEFRQTDKGFAPLHGPAGDTVQQKGGPVSEGKRPDANITRLLQYVIEGRVLVVEELDEIISFFQEKRDQLAQSRGIAPSKSTLPDKQSPSKGQRGNEEQRADLQERIMHMLERDPTLVSAAKGVMESTGIGRGANDGSSLSHFGTPQVPPGQLRDIPDKRMGMFKDDQSMGRFGSANQRDLGDSYGYGVAEEMGGASYPSQGNEYDYRGLKPTFPGTQQLPGAGIEDIPGAANQPPIYSYPPPPPPAGPMMPKVRPDSQGQDWSGMAGGAGFAAASSSSSNGRPPWRPDFRGPGGAPDFRNPPPQVPAWGAGGRQYSQYQ